MRIGDTTRGEVFLLPKGKTLPTIRWQASREGVCWVGSCKDLLGWGNENTLRLEGRYAQEYCGPNVWESPAGNQQSK